MFKKVVLCFATVALAIATAASHRLTLHRTVYLAGQQLNAGEYKLEFDNNKATLKGKGVELNVDVKVEATEAKHPTTTVRYREGDRGLTIQEIRLGGTNTKLVFN